MQDKAVFVLDRHPTTYQHSEWLKKHLLPSLGISQKQTEKVDFWIDTVNDAYKNSHREFDTFCEILDSKIIDRENYYRGF